ncbi:hypothetical protein Tco_1105466 [Tanacetum coccineum]
MQVLPLWCILPLLGAHVIELMDALLQNTIDMVSEHLDFMPCGATTLTKHVVEVVDFENQKVVERHVVVEMDYKCPVANYPWFKHRDHLVTFEVEEVLEVLVLSE